MIGFSAGGHLAALAGTQPIGGNPEADDPIDRVSSRPDYLVLGYPWIGAISSDTSHLSYCKLYNVMDRCEALRAAYSPDLFVTQRTPPTFWYHTFTRPDCAGGAGFAVLRGAGEGGCSGGGARLCQRTARDGVWQRRRCAGQWPGLLETWLRAQGLLTPESLWRHEAQPWNAQKTAGT